MRKGDAFSVGRIAKIILIALILFIILSALNGLYGQTFKDGIKKLFGEKTETEITHEQNTQAEKDFQALENQIKNVKSQKIQFQKFLMKTNLLIMQNLMA